MQIHQWGGFLTSSIAINRISWLWNVLTYNLVELIHIFL